MPKIDWRSVVVKVQLKKTRFGVGVPDGSALAQDDVPRTSAALNVPSSAAALKNRHGVEPELYLSPLLVLAPGDDVCFFGDMAWSFLMLAPLSSQHEVILLEQ
jgi:hypothetical protein